MLTEEQLARRHLGIGASEIGDVFNLEPYGCRRRLFYRKKQVAPDYALIPTVAMERGNFFEPIVADLYADKTGRLVEEHKETIRMETSPMFCHLDRLTVIVKDRVPLEIKVPGERMFNEIRRNGIPDAYILQLQDQIAIWGSEVGGFGVFCPDNVGFLAPDVERDESIIKEIVSACTLFWDEMTVGKEPDRLKPTDKRCPKCNWRTSCQGKHLLASVKDAPEWPDIISLEFDSLMIEYWRAKEIADEAGELLEGVKTRIKEKMGKWGVAETIGSRIYYKPVVSNRLDTGALKHDEPEIAQKYLKESVSRPLRIYAI